jgi:transposase
MKPWNQITHYAGLDWAKHHHDVVVLDASGRIVDELRFEHTAEGWNQLRQRLAAFPAVAVAIETNQGAAVEKLLESDCTVYPVNPKSAERYRERQVPSGNKTDRVDSWSLADALRLDGHGWRPLAPEDPLVQQLRLLCRDEVELIEQRTALVNQLQAALYEYYPAALSAFDDWTSPAAWAFVAAFPTPQALTRAGRRKWENFLHAHRLWRPQTVTQRLDCFARAEQFCGNESVTTAKSLRAKTLVKLLDVLHRQLQEYRKLIEELFGKHPDHDLFGSLPGVGASLGPRLAAEISRLTEPGGPTAHALQCVAGTAPVGYQSGQIRTARLRRACNKHLRHTVHLWADLSRQYCPWAAAYYSEHRKHQKQSHATALRCLGQRWLKILAKMLQTHTCYDADLHTRNQTQHGSWVIALKTT